MQKDNKRLRRKNFQTERTSKIQQIKITKQNLLIKSLERQGKYYILFQNVTYNEDSMKKNKLIKIKINL